MELIGPDSIKLISFYICSMRLLARFFFWISGWKVVGEVPKGLMKAVMVAAPHTSNWDFLYARLAFFIMGVRLRYTIKKELFFFPLGILLRVLGGLPINRSSRENMVERMIGLFERYDKLVLLITPEGTRSYSKVWKKGFYYVAQGARVPLVLGYLDYKKKHAGIGPVIYPSGNYERDLLQIKDFLRNVTPKYPENGIEQAG